MRIAHAPKIETRHQGTAGYEDFVSFEITMQVDDIERRQAVLYRRQHARQIKRQTRIVFKDRRHRLTTADKILHSAAMANPARDFIIGERIRGNAPTSFV